MKASETIRAESGEKDYVHIVCSERVLIDCHGDDVDKLLVRWQDFNGVIESAMEFEDGPLTFTVEVKHFTDAERDRWCEEYGFTWEE